MPFHAFRFPAILKGIVLGTCLFWSGSTLHAGPVDPPFELLYGAGNLLVVGSVSEINPAGRVVFARKKVLSGKPKPPELIDVGVPPAVLAGVKPGENYVVGYSAYRRNRKINALVANAEGPILLVSIGLDPALFRDTPAVRRLLAAGRSESGRESRRFREQLLQALAGDDASLQVLAAGEIALNADVRARIGDRAALARFARDGRASPAARALLLEAASSHPEQLGDWWQAVATEIVTSTPVDGYADGTSDPSNLVLDALDTLDRQGSVLDAGVLKRWLRGANPSLAERAALMLRKASPEAERTAVKEAFADPATPERTRRFLEAHLRRIERAQPVAVGRVDR